MVTLQAESKAGAKQERLFYLDWLRVLAVSGVFFYHTLRPFDLTDWNVKNAQQSLVVYEFLIRRMNAMRWLFGMKPRQRTPHPFPASLHR